MSLNIGWRQWDTYLKKFVDKEINCLEIGSYKGDATEKMLVHLSTNPKSRVYAVDTWAGSPEYPNMDFSLIEKEFDERMKKTGKDNQLIKMKMLSSKALMKLIQDKIMFDFIYIDASHEAKDVLSDAILSWEILKEGGIIIFDDYQWDKLKEDYSRPKLAIDSFISIYKPELKVLFSKYQLGIEKIKRKKVEVSEYYDLYNKLLSYDIKTYSSTFELKIEDKIKFKLKLSKIKNPLITDNSKFDKITKIIEKSNLDILTSKFFNYDGKNLKDYDKELIDYSMNRYKIIYDINIKTLHNIKKLYYLNYLINKYINTNIKKLDIFIAIRAVDKYCYYCDLIKKKNKDIIFNFNNYEDDLLYKTSDYLININNKFDLIYLSNKSKNNLNNIFINKRLDFNYYIFNNLLFCLEHQKINGSCIIQIPNIFNSFISEIIFLLNKYYKKVVIINYLSSKLILNVKIISYYFKGINNNELKELQNIKKDIINKNDNLTNINNSDNYYYLNSIIDNSIIKNNNNYDKITKELKQINNNNLDILYDKYKFYNNYFNYINNENNSKKDIIELKKKHYQIFLSNFNKILYSSNLL